MIIEASAPTRIDLAGGTIDIWPLYLFHPGAATVNFAISLEARCSIETRGDDRIVLESTDRNMIVESTVPGLENLAREKRLELISRLVHFFKPETGLHLTAHCEAPAGSGLGGSSALAIACIAALNRLVGDRYPEHRFITIAANIETTVIRVPAGFQDYYGAFYGGANCIHFGPEGIRREPLRIDYSALQSRIVICYTGEPRLSGTNNWEIFKNHIDGNAGIFSLFEEIGESARQMRDALVASEWDRVAAIMQRAYPARKLLAPGVTTPGMEKIIAKALAHGAIAAKVCGAGGGGCIAFLTSPEGREELEQVLANDERAQILNWRFAPDGLKIKQSG